MKSIRGGGNQVRAVTARLCRASFGAALAASAAAPSLAQQIPSAGPPRVQTAAEALAQDGAEYARAYGVTPEEAIARLRAQQESVAATEDLRSEFRSRLAGISIEHSPQYRIVVLLTGPEPVADREIRAGGIAVPIVFRTGARASREQILVAMHQYRPTLAAELPRARGMGVDQRTGQLVLLVRAADVERLGGTAIQQRVEAATGVPVRLVVADVPVEDLALAGGGRIEGVSSVDGKRYACTTGFVVTDGSRTGIATAAHCPDVVTYRGLDGAGIPLEFVGQWGARYQDVQIHVGNVEQAPLFYADRRSGALRKLTSWRNRTATRAGDVVCRWGESSGYSCSEVELTDFAPPGELCAGPCDPLWVTVKGPHCLPGDSGGPVFSGSVAFGISKGGSRTPSGHCNFYYYMSTDFLPAGWSLLHEGRASGSRSSLRVEPR